MKKGTKVLTTVFAVLLSAMMFAVAGCNDKPSVGPGGEIEDGERVNRGLGMNGGGGTPGPSRKDIGWAETVFYATSGPNSSMLATGVTVTHGSPQFPSNRVNAAGYYPVGGISGNKGITINYDMVIDRDAEVGLYAEFGNRNGNRTFDECFTLTVNDETVEVGEISMPAYYDDYTPNNRFVFLSFIDLKAEQINRISLTLTAEDGFGYNFYAYKFTAEEAKVAMDLSSLVPRDELVDKGYVKYMGEQRITLNGANTPNISVNGSINTGTWNSLANRLYVQKANPTATFTLKIDPAEIAPDLEDISRMGLLLNHNIARTGAVLEYSTDNANWNDLARYGDDSLKGDYGVQTDQCEDSWMLSLRKGDFNDANVWSCFFEIGKYFDENKVLYIRASYAGSGDAGCDWLGSYSIFDSLEIVDKKEEAEKQEYTLTLAYEHAHFVGGGTTAEVLEGARLPDIEFDEGYGDALFGWATENAEEWWTPSDFRMPAKALSIRPVFDHDDYVQTNEEGFHYGDGRLYFGETTKGDTDNVTNKKGSISIVKNALDLPKTVLSDYSTAFSLGITASAGAAFRLHTGYQREANVKYTVTYKFYNVGDADMNFRIYQINAGATLTDFYQDVVIKAGEHKTVEITFSFDNTNGNLLSYFVFNEACSGAKLAVNAFIEKND